MTPNTEQSGTSLKKIFSYFFPELITAWLLYIGLEIIDFRFIACTNVALCSTTLGISNSFLHLITKVAEGFSVGMVIICGQYNGAGEYQRTGRVLTDALWITTIIGAIIALGLYTSAHTIYDFYEVPQEIVDLGVPFLKIRALGVFFSFVYFTLIGFLRGIKNTKVPMLLFLLGALVFLFFDYALIFGKYGFPALGLRGSAIATVLQYATMLTGALLYVLTTPHHRKYAIKPFLRAQWSTARNLIYMSWPVMIDKASFALSPIWLTKMLACTAKLSTLSTKPMLLDSYVVLKTMERVGILPAVAFAQVITFLVSNDYKIHDFKSINKNIIKILLLATGAVGLFTFFFCLYPQFFLRLLGKADAYNEFIAYALPYIAVIIFFDVSQLILAASLRGAANVRTVMWARLATTGLFFIPFSYTLCKLPLDNMLIKFMLIYGSVHVSYAIMSFIYLVRLKGDNWKEKSLK